MNEDSLIAVKWNEIKTVMEVLDVDVAKNMKGVAAAGVRTRKGLRQLRALSKEFIKITVENDKKNKAEKKKNKSK